jgi:hypothetical protein
MGIAIGDHDIFWGIHKEGIAGEVLYIFYHGNVSEKKPLFRFLIEASPVTIHDLVPLMKNYISTQILNGFSINRNIFQNISLFKPQSIILGKR